MNNLPGSSPLIPKNERLASLQIIRECNLEIERLRKLLNELTPCGAGERHQDARYQEERIEFFKIVAKEKMDGYPICPVCVREALK